MKNTRPLKVMFTTAALAAALTGCGSDSDSPPADGGQGGVDANAAPVITSTALASVLENAAYEYTLVATDADDDELVYSATTLPAGFAFNAATGVLSSADVGAAASHDVVLSVTDGEDSTTDTFTITVAIDDGSVFTVFKDSVVSGWAVWGEGGQLPVFATDADAAYGEVVEFANFGDGDFAAGQTVNGFSASLLKQGGGVAFDASAYRDTGSIQFDIKMTAAPELTDTWFFKVESSEGQATGQAFEIDTPVLDEWVHYVVPLSLVSEDNAAELINLMVFPNWGDNEGARFSIDNLQIFPTTPYLDLRTPLDGDVVLFDDALNTDWAIWQNSNGEAAANTITAIQDDELGAVIGLTSIGQEVAGITTLSQKVAGLTDATFDASAFAGGTLHFDMKLTAETAVAYDTWLVKLEGVGAAETSIPAPLLGHWMHYSVDLAAFGDLTALNNIMIFPAWSDDAAGAAYSVDNITFSTEAPVDVVVEVVPTVAAPTPTALEADVISIFSDAYTDVADTDFNPNWGQSTVVTQEAVADNNTLKYVNLNYQGTQFTAQDVSAMTSVHVDFWTADATALQLFLISGSGEQAYDFTITEENWVSVDIPLTAFSDISLTDVIQFKVVGNGTVYLDNLYFH